MESFHHRRQGQVLLGYLFAMGLATSLAAVTPCAACQPVLLGATFPGAGFLHWADASQYAPAAGLFAAGLVLFGFALLLWFATGNILAPIAAWIGLAAVSGFPEALGLDEGATADAWPWAIGPGLLVAGTLAWLRPGGQAVRTGPTRVRRFAEAGMAGDANSSLSGENNRRLRLLLDRALQPADDFNGFEWRDQFQTAAVRYQVNFMAYALAMARQCHAPAAAASFAEAQERLLIKIGDRRLWSYWRLENAWGNLSVDADPVPRQNIMYSGFTALQMALGGGEALDLHRKGGTWRSYRLGQIAALLENQYRSSRYGLLACEPGWIYPLCNLIAMAGVKASDARLGTDRWQHLQEPFLAALDREATRPDGSFIAFRSSLTGIAPPAPGGIVMQAFPCLFLNALAPDRAEEAWHRVRQRLDNGSWRRLFWPVDVGNYGFSRASGYAAVAATAVEMGDREIADECLARLELECPSHEISGVIHRERASLWAHSLELMARCGRAGGLRDLASDPGRNTGPLLASAPYPEVQILNAVSGGRNLRLTLEPLVPGATSLIELGGLMPGRHYRTGFPGLPFVKADNNGRALLRFPIPGRIDLNFAPVV